MKTTLKPDTTVPKLPPDTAAARAEFCRRFLYYHEFITEAESEKVRQRIIKWTITTPN